MSSDQQQTWQTTDEVLDSFALRNEGETSALADIALHLVIETRRLADAAERQAAALERIAECAAPHDNTPEGEPVFWVGKAY